MKKTLLTLLFLSLIFVARAQTETTEQKRLSEYSVLFNWNRWELTESARAELTKLLAELKSHPEATIAIVGWADKTGADIVNKRISLSRAKIVGDYLQENGIASDRITIDGKGVDVQAETNTKARRADISIVVYLATQIPVVQPTPEPIIEPVAQIVEPQQPAQPIQVVQPAQEVVAPSSSKLNRWSVGVNVGIPFFWGDMVSMSADKSYIGVGVGVQGSYRISKLLGVSLSVDWAQGKTGARDYSQGYLLTPDGMTHYLPQSDNQQYYSNLYSKISVVTLGASLDLCINRIFSEKADRHRFTAWISPTIYGQFFSANVYNKTDNKKFSDGTTKPSTISLGLGGALSLRYKITNSIEIQFKNSLIWITDSKFDGITTTYSKTTKQNAMWTPQIGVIWNIK